MIDALDLYREMVSKLSETEFFGTIDKLKIRFSVPLKMEEIEQFLTQMGDACFERKIKELLGAGKDGKLIERHTQIPPSAQRLSL